MEIGYSPDKFPDLKSYEEYHKRMNIDPYAKGYIIYHDQFVDSQSAQDSSMAVGDPYWVVNPDGVLVRRIVGE